MIKKFSATTLNNLIGHHVWVITNERKADAAGHIRIKPNLCIYEGTISSLLLERKIGFEEPTWFAGVCIGTNELCFMPDPIQVGPYIWDTEAEAMSALEKINNINNRNLSVYDAQKLIKAIQ